MKETINILMVEDNDDFGKLVELYLSQHPDYVFQLVWEKSGEDGLRVLETDQSFHVILMDYNLPGMNGVEVTSTLVQRGITIPVVFITVNRDFNLAVETMKLGVEDFLVKEEISTPVLPRTIVSVLDRVRLRQQLTALEISSQRMEAIQELVLGISQDLLTPLEAMERNVQQLAQSRLASDMSLYLRIIGENVDRMRLKLGKLKSLKEDKTVQYIKNIKMIDISD
ncbi:MAG TPA: response regulator [Bacteroidota bacterium]|nr:response regulator [Bacteroidota bacterium]